MISIKKVEVAPVDMNYGKIIDSDSTTDSKTTNTYSMRVIDEKIAQSGTILVLNRTSLVPGNSSKLVTFEFGTDLPEDFNVDNTAVISYCVQVDTEGDIMVYNPDENNNVRMRVWKDTNNDYLQCRITSDYSGEMYVNWQIVLMKVS